MPLPSFLNESPEAREVFSTALAESKRLRQSLNYLSGEEKEILLEAFSESINKNEVTKLETIAHHATGFTGTLSVTLAAITYESNPLLFIAACANVLLSIYGSFNLINKRELDDRDREMLKKQLLGALI